MRFKAILLITLLMILFCEALQAGEPRVIRLEGASAMTDRARTVIVEETAGKIDLKVTVAEYQHQAIDTKHGEFSLVFLPGHGITNEIGAPGLPAIHEFIEIPGDARAEVVMTGGTYLDCRLEDLGLLKIMPVQAPVPKIRGALEKAAFTMNPAIYGGNAFYPEAAFRAGEPGRIRNHAVMSLTIHPILYNPPAGLLRCYSEMFFEVRLYRQKSEPLDPRLVSPYFERDLEKIILNPRSFVEKSMILNLPVGYLVICPGELSSNIQPFTDWRMKKGFKVALAGETEIPDWTAAGIAQYIQDAYDQWPVPPTAVLLVGDTNYIPTFTGSRTYEATDLYFATVSGSDVLPDLYIARMPARDATDVDDMVSKFLDYERNNLGSGWYDQACFLAPPDSGQQGEQTHNACIENYFEPAGLTCYKIYSRLGGDTADITNNLNAGRTTCQYSGHGYTEGWAEPAFSINTINSQLNNTGMYPFVSSFACLTGLFSQTECFGEAWVKRPNKGAISFWGSSPSSYWDEDDILERRLWAAHFQDDKWTFGEMCNQALLELWDHYNGGGLSKYYLEAYNILGDPLIDMWSAPPETLSVAFPPSIPPEDGNVDVTVEAGGSPVENALVCIMQAGGFHEAAFTDSSGTATIAVYPADTSPCDITVTAHNKDPFESTISVESSGQDHAAPFLAAHYPAPDTAGASPHSRIKVHVMDAGTGVNQGSIRMWINGQPVSPEISGSSRDFKLVYDTGGTYDFGSAVQITVEADDFCAPPLQLSAIYSFSVTSAADSDDDGLPDGWEEAHGLDPQRSDGRDGAQGDADRDGDSNLQEYQGGLDPTSPSAVITGPGFGPSNDTLVRVFDAEGNLLETTGFTAYADMPAYGLNVAGADVDGDHFDEILTGPGPGSENRPQVKVFESGGDSMPGVNFLAYGVMKYGVHVAGGNVTADMTDEIITGAGPGSVFAPHVRGWSCDTGEALPLHGINYFAYGTRKYGARVGTGDVDGDGLDEIITGAGPGPVFGPHVRGWNYNGQAVSPIQNASFFAYGTKKWGVGVSSGDLDRDGLDEIITGAGPGPVFGPHVRAWDYASATGVRVISGVNFFAYGSRKYGVAIAGGDFDSDGCDEIVTGPGPGEGFGSRVRGWNYDGDQLTLTSLDFFAYDRLVYRYGVSVATARTDF